MQAKWLKRFLFGCLCALFLGSITAVATQASTPQQADEPTIPGDDCQSCHEEIVTLWENGAHSQASTDTTFLEAWYTAEQDPACLSCHTTGYDVVTHSYDEAEITCQACHPSDPTEHPQKLMYTNTSSSLCGDCHLETFTEMNDSIHSAEGMDCIRCHNPHDTGLRAGQVQDTCKTCHRNESHFFNYTPHASEGLQCVDCHLQVKEGDMGNGHGRLSHTFTVGMDTCATCHAEEMHYPTEYHDSGSMAGEPTDADCVSVANTTDGLIDGSTDVQNTPICQGVEESSSTSDIIMEAGIMPPLGDSDSDNLKSQPADNRGFNLVILAAIIGVLFGLAGSPWLEKWYVAVRNDQADS